jgi:hypothetical protein
MPVERESIKHWIIPGSARPGALFEGVIQVTDGITRLDVAAPAFAYAAAEGASLVAFASRLRKTNEEMIDGKAKDLANLWGGL